MLVTYTLRDRDYEVVASVQAEHDTNAVIFVPTRWGTLWLYQGDPGPDWYLYGHCSYQEGSPYAMTITGLCLSRANRFWSNRG